MNERFVLDASAVLALFKREKGSDIVRKVIRKSFISTVNYTEVASVLMRELTIEDTDKILTSVGMEIIDFNYEQARYASEILPKTTNLRLSLGDRSCLALAKTKGLSVLTADKLWQKLDIGIEIILIR